MMRTQLGSLTPSGPTVRSEGDASWYRKSLCVGPLPCWLSLAAALSPVAIVRVRGGSLRAGGQPDHV